MIIIKSDDLRIVCPRVTGSDVVRLADAVPMYEILDYLGDTMLSIQGKKVHSAAAIAPSCGNLLFHQEAVKFPLVGKVSTSWKKRKE